MDQPIALVTGASRGIGYAVALELARAGFHVVATARTEGGLTELDDAIRAEGGSATLLPLDLLDGAGLDMIGPSIFDRFGRLDALVYSAGALGRLTPVPHILPADWNAVVGVNLAAAWRLIRSCAPVLQVAPAGRAVFLTDLRAAEPRAYWGAYGATKAALDHLVLTWAAEGRDVRAAGQFNRSRAGRGSSAHRGVPGRGSEPGCASPTMSPLRSPRCVPRRRPGTARSFVSDCYASAISPETRRL